MEVETNPVDASDSGSMIEADLEVEQMISESEIPASESQPVDAQDESSEQKIEAVAQPEPTVIGLTEEQVNARVKGSSRRGAG